MYDPVAVELLGQPAQQGPPASDVSLRVRCPTRTSRMGSFYSLLVLSPTTAAISAAISSIV